MSLMQEFQEKILMSMTSGVGLIMIIHSVRSPKL